MLTNEQFETWKRDVYANPTGVDISRLEPAAYKFFDGYRNLVYMFREEQITKDECVSKTKLLMKEYNDNIEAYTRYYDVCKEHQDMIRATDGLMHEMATGSYNTAETLQLALQLIALIRNDEPTRVAILRRLNLEPYIYGEQGVYSDE